MRIRLCRSIADPESLKTATGKRRELPLGGRGRTWWRRAGSTAFLTLSLAATALAGSQPSFDLATVEALLSRAQPGASVVAIDDMLFRVEDLLAREKRLRAAAASGVRSSVGIGVSKWPGGRVPYVFDPGVNSTRRAQFLAACKEWEAVAAVTFAAAADDDLNYVYVVASPDSNSSFIGMLNGGQVINIVSWSSKYIICHELAHALGVSHEQCRSDRDTYVTIHLENVQSGKAHNFTKISTTNQTPYDFESIMHYGARDFSTSNAPVIVANRGYEVAAQGMGNRTYLSRYDVESMAALYGKAEGKGNISLVYASHMIHDDDGVGGIGNGDGTVNPSESIDLDVYVRNVGTSPATNVKATLSTTSSAVTVTGGEVTIASIKAGESKVVQPFRFNVAGTTPGGQEIEFTLKLQSPEVTSTQKFSLVVGTDNGGVALRYHGHAVHDGSGVGKGNSDGQINPGESIDLDVTVRNAGAATATGVRAVLSSTNPYITLTDPVVALGNLAPGISRLGSGLNFDVAGAVPKGQTAAFLLEIESDQGTFAQRFSLPIASDGTPSIRLAGTRIDDDSVGGSSGDGDGIAEAGETIEIAVTLENQGDYEAKKVDLVASQSSADATFVKSTAGFGAIAAGSSATALDLSLTIDADTPRGRRIFVNLQIQADQQSFTQAFGLTVDPPLPAPSPAPLLVRPPLPRLAAGRIEGRPQRPVLRVTFRDDSASEDYYLLQISRRAGKSWSAWKTQRRLVSPSRSGAVLSTTFSLAPRTLYRSRIVAVNKTGATSSRPFTFRTR